MNRINSRSLKVYVMYCANSLSTGELDNALQAESGDEFKIMSLPCSGKVDVLYLVKAFETGADGIVLVTCGKNECRHLEGNLRAPKRAEKVNSLMAEIGMGRDRVAIIPKDENGVESLASGISEFCGKLRNMNVLSAAKVS